MEAASLSIQVYPVSGPKVWPHFASHHYLNTKYNGHRAFIACLPDGTPVAFLSLIRLPHAQLKNAWRSHRTVVLPDFQGLGIGTRLSDWLGEYVIQVMNGRFYSRTTHPRMGIHRDRSPRWRATSMSGRKRTETQGNRGITTWKVDMVRTCWSHEYIGNPST
jgi:GNAT superfamily N-acetyltransferase